jgi:hypothetical protein
MISLPWCFVMYEFDDNISAITEYISIHEIMYDDDDF